LPDGDFSIVAQKTGYDTATVSVSITRAAPQPVTILLRASAPAHPLSLYNPISAHELAVPQRARAAYDKGRALLEDQNKPADSIPEFQQAIDAYPSYYEAYSKIGIANYKLGKLSDAEIALKKAIDLSSNKSLEPLYLLADLYNGQRKYADAESLARQAVALDESSWNGHFELARALVGMRKGDQAEASALRATQLKPDNAPAHLVLANAHMLGQHYSAAIAEFDMYLTLEPDGPLSPAVRQQRDRLKDQLQAAPPPPVTNNQKP
jgi:tetratricopeptide (TPR) repeat protein